MIPKIIHYCWFGGKPKPPLVLRCMESWRKHLPDWEIVEWNEQSFQVNSHPFVEKVYSLKKWAFVSDYVRMWAICKHGGVYLDTDVELFDSMDVFLSNSAFTGFEKFGPSINPFTAVFGATQGHPWVEACLAYYDSVHDADLLKVNTAIVSELLLKNSGVVINNQTQCLLNGVMLYNSAVLCTPNLWHKCYSVHHFNGSWLDAQRKSRLIRLFNWASFVSPLWLDFLFSKLILKIRNR